MNWEMVIFIIYFIFMLGIGLNFFFKSKDAGEKDYFLGGRQMGAWVSALSAGASDMSAWVLMGLPASIFALGMGQTWIAIGLGIGYALSWIIEAPRLRRFSIKAKDSITIPQYLTNRFLSQSKALQIICAVIFLVAYTIYAASSIKACGTLFNQVMGIDATIAMYIAAAIIIAYTFLGGFSAVCWTDFFQGMLMLAALLVAPIFALALLKGGSVVTHELPEGFFNFGSSWQDIVSGLGWGLGYFGMPHIIVRFMSVKSEKELRKSSVIGISWTVIILFMSVMAATVGRMFLGELEDSSTVFIQMVRKIFPPVLSGICLSAILAASMSTADSQLLVASSSFTSDIYKPVIRKKASDKELLWVGRIVVLVVAIIAYFIASSKGSGAQAIMNMVENAWGIFGAAFGPVVILSLFWKRFTYKGAVAGIVSGAVVDILWLLLLSGPTGVYEILPGFVVSAVLSIVVSLLDKAPGEQVLKIYEKAMDESVDD